MRIAVTGCKGQLGRLIIRSFSEQHQVVGLDVPEFELTSSDSIDQLAQCHPDLVIHCAAMTDVDACARNPALAFRVNALGTQSVALACQRIDAAMLYISTNEVFDGEKQAPYLEFDTPRPINPYAKSKLAGEWFTQHLVRRFYIVRTSWLFKRGSGKFVDKVLEVASRDAPLAFVTDEIGCPTYMPDLVQALGRLIASERYGIYHLVNSGACSRYEWAVEILRQVGIARPIKPIRMVDYSRASTPPRNGALENFVAAETLGITFRPWQEAMAENLSAHV